MRHGDVLALMNVSRHSVAAYGHSGKVRKRQAGCRLTSEIIDRRKAGSEWRSSRAQTYKVNPENIERYLAERYGL